MGSYFFDIQYRNLQSKMDQDFLDIKYGLGKVSRFKYHKYRNR